MKSFKYFLLSLIIIAGFIALSFYINGKKEIVLSFNEDVYYLETNDELSLEPVIKNGPKDDTVELVYFSSDEEIVLYSDGKLKALASGEVIIKAVLKDDDEIYAEAKVIVSEPEQSIKITYHLNDGVNHDNNPEEILVSDLPFYLYNPSKGDDTFLGWYLDSDFSGQSIDVITSDLGEKINLYARWKDSVISRINIAYHLDGGVNHKDNYDSLTINDLPFNLQNPTKEGFVFMGWYLNSNFSGESISVITSDLGFNVSLYAKFEEILPDEYVINYYLDGGINSKENLFKFTKNELPLTLNDPVKEGFVFMGWYLNSNFSGEQVTSLTEEKDYYLYARWEKIITTYNITYHLDGGVNNPLNVSTFKNTELPLTLKEPLKEGFEFIGWYLNSNFSGEQVTSLTEEKDYNLYARWEKIITTYNITYHLDGGVNNSLNKSTITSEELPFTLYKPTKEGYSFLGWYLDNDTSSQEVTELNLSNVDGIVLYALWGNDLESEAILAVKIAETSRFAADIDVARVKVLRLDNESLKDELLYRLDNIEIIDEDPLRDDSTIIP